MFDLHPKVRAALLVALASALVTVVNAVADVYPNNAFSVVLVALLPVVGGWLKAAE